MKRWSDGDKVRIIKRAVTEEDRKENRYFDHMAGLVGTVQSVYGQQEVAVEIELSSLSTVSASVHKASMLRMREKFLTSVSEEQKKELTTHELEFTPHYVALVRADDLECL